MTENFFKDILPTKTIDFSKPAVQDLAEFAQAVQDYVGGDVLFKATPHQSASEGLKVDFSVYVPATAYANIVLVAMVSNSRDGYPVRLDVFFTPSAFRTTDAVVECTSKDDLKPVLQKWLNSAEGKDLLDYLKRYSRQESRSVVAVEIHGHNESLRCEVQPKEALDFGRIVAFDVTVEKELFAALHVSSLYLSLNLRTNRLDAVQKERAAESLLQKWPNIQNSLRDKLEQSGDEPSKLEYKTIKVTSGGEAQIWDSSS